MFYIIKNNKANFRRIIFIMVLLTTSKSLFSQKNWTLDDCIAYALEHNLQLNDFELTKDSSKERYRQSVRDLLPSIVLDSDYGTRFGRSIDPNDNSISETDFAFNRYSLKGSLDLFQSFQKQNAIKASKFVYQAAKEETLQQKYLLAFRVMQAFYDIRFFKGALEIAKEQQEISRSNYELIKKQVDLGIMAGADLYDAESIFLSDKLAVTRAENQIIAAKIVLKQEMNLQDVNDILLKDEIIKDIDVSENSVIVSDSIYNQAKEFIPIIKAGKLRVKGAQKQLAIERGKLYPSLRLFGEYGTGYFETIRDTSGEVVSFSNQLSNNAFQVIGVSLNIPISNGWFRRSNIKQQKIALLRADNELAIREQGLYQTIQDVVQEYNAIQLEYKQTSKNIEFQNQAFTVAQKRYEKGIINGIELFTAKNLLASAQNQNLLTKLKVIVNKSTLDFYKGLPVFDIENDAEN